MDKKEFMWHAKRGHGICVFLIKKDKNIYFNCIKKIILNNYAFLNDNEYRSSYAYELVSYYDNKFDFVNLIIKKLFRLRLSDDYTICYLLNNLFFFSMTDKHKKRIVKLLKKWINKINYSKKEIKSLKSLFELIVDKDIFIDECKKILNDYLLMFPKSNIKIDIKELRPKNYITLKNDKIISFDEININIINKIVDNDYFKKVYPLFSIYATNELIGKLIDEFNNKILDKDTKKKILILISSMNNLRLKYIKFLHNNLFKIDKETDLEILYCISNQKKKNLKILFSNLKNTTYEPLLIPIILNNYEESDYKTINNLLKKIKINYSDTSYWFECEDALIKYFNKKIIDKRLLKNIYNFFRNGLCSTSRYNLIKILLKYNKLSNEEINYCRYDSDYNTRKLIKKYKFFKNHLYLYNGGFFMKYYCLQLNECDCGYAVIKMLLANVNNDKNYLFMKEDITKKSYSLLELKKIGEKYNLNLKGFEVKDFKSINKFPFIALININKQNHYVIVNKITKNYIYYFDPKLKKQKVEINIFKNLFTGYILMIDNYKRTKCDNYYKSFKNYYFVYSIGFNLIQFILLFLSSFVLNNIYQLTIMIILFFIIMIFNQIFNNIILKKYDKKIVCSSINKDNSFENIKNEFNLKKDYFSYYQNIIYKSSILSFLIIFLLINDIKNLLFIFCITLFIYFKELILFEINQPLKFNNYLLEINNDYLKANSLAYSIINKINIFNILKYVLIVICDFIICFYNKNFSPFIYYLIINEIVYDNLNYLYINDDYLLLNKEILIHLHVN